MHSIKILLPALIVSSMVACHEVLREPFGKDVANLTDYELKGISALFELANLTMHIPESFILSRHTSADVHSQIRVFDDLASPNIAAAGFVSAFLDIINNDEDVAYYLKAIDMRLRMLRYSSTNYTTVLP